MKVFRKAFGISSFAVGFVAFALVAVGYIAKLVKYLPNLTSGGTIDAAALVIVISNALFALLCVTAAILALVSIIRLCMKKEINEIRSVSRVGSLYTAGFFVSVFAISILIPVLSHIIAGTPLALTAIDYIGNALPFVALILFSVGSFLRKENRIGGGIVFAIGALIMVAISVLTISTSNPDQLFAGSDLFSTISTIGTLIVSIVYFILASVYVFLPEGESEEEIEVEPEAEDQFLGEQEEQPVEKVRKDEEVAPVVISESQEEKVEEAPKAEETVKEEKAEEPVKEEKVEEVKAEEPVKEEKVEEVKAEEAKPAPKTVKKAEEKPAKKVEAKPAEKKESAKKAEPKPAKKVEAKPAEKKEAPKKAEAKPAAKEEKSSAADKTRVYHVVKREKDNKWEVKFAGGEKAIKLFNTQKEAIEYSKVMAENQGGTYLVHNSKGANKGRIQKK